MVNTEILSLCQVRCLFYSSRLCGVSIAAGSQRLPFVCSSGFETPPADSSHGALLQSCLPWVLLINHQAESQVALRIHTCRQFPLAVLASSAWWSASTVSYRCLQRSISAEEMLSVTPQSAPRQPGTPTGSLGSPRPPGLPAGELLCPCNRSRGAQIRASSGKTLSAWLQTSSLQDKFSN